ncbi:methyltransferase domain-containing protein [Streptomyces sp. L7]
MRVLDVGCGTGEVSLCAARIVGPSGRVVGVDMEPGGPGARTRQCGGILLRERRLRTG